MGPPSLQQFRFLKFPFPEFWLNENWLRSEGRGSKSSVYQITPGQDVRKDCERGNFLSWNPSQDLSQGPTKLIMSERVLQPAELRLTAADFTAPAKVPGSPAEPSLLPAIRGAHRPTTLTLEASSGFGAGRSWGELYLCLLLQRPSALTWSVTGLWC